MRRVKKGAFTERGPEKRKSTNSGQKKKRKVEKG